MVYVTGCQPVVMIEMGVQGAKGRSGY